MAADVVREAVRAALARRESAHLRVTLEDHEVSVAQLTKAVACAKSCGTGADNDDARLVSAALIGVDRRH